MAEKRNNVLTEGEREANRNLQSVQVSPCACIPSVGQDGLQRVAAVNSTSPGLGCSNYCYLPANPITSHTITATIVIAYINNLLYSTNIGI